MYNENIDIKAWAQQIRIIKIRELEELIKFLEKEYRKNYENMFVITRCHERARISELKTKLKFIQNN